MIQEPPQSISPSSLDSQLARLSNVQNSLRDFQKFIDEQKKRLIATENNIKSLEKEQSKLESIVKLDKQAVADIIAFVQEDSTQNIWLEKIIVFVMGICASLIASIILSRKGTWSLRM